MDGRRRLYDNIFVERLWPRIKYEEVYLHDYRTVQEAREILAAHFHFRTRNGHMNRCAIGHRTKSILERQRSKHRFGSKGNLVWTGSRSSIVGQMVKPFFRFFWKNDFCK